LPAEQSETSVLEREVRVEAAPETIFAFFTDPEKMVRWMGMAATLDPRPGGTFRLNIVLSYSMEGKYVEVEPYSRVVFTWGYAEIPDESPNPLPPGSSTVEVALVPDGDATIVRLTHRLPSDLYDFHAMGWDYYLGRLAIVTAGEDPGPDLMAEVAMGWDV
jgi:uncharacterized protein YndB with AHSA1/START domain